MEETMRKLRYWEQTEYSAETVEFLTFDADGCGTTCVVNVENLLKGATSFPCGNGDDLTLNREQLITVLHLVKAKRYEKWCAKTDALINAYMYA